jgi:DNA mismatch repair protein MutL
MMKFALSHPNLRFTFYDGDNLIFDVHPSGLEERIVHLLGNTVAGSLIRVNFENEFIKIWGYVGQPHLARNSSSGQHLFLNGRAIQSKALSHAIFASFEHLLEKNHKPLFILNIEIDPEQIDINVHPQKHEVKFEDERLIYNTLRKAVTMGLQEYDLTPAIELIRHQVNSPFELSSDDQSGDSFIVNKITGELIEQTPVRQFEMRQQNFTERYNPKDYPKGSDRLFDGISAPKEEVNGEMSAFDMLFNPDRRKVAAPINSINGTTGDDSSISYWQLHNKYILMQTEKGMLIIDQHNAHERVLFEKAIKMMNKEFRSSQTLLFPVTINVSVSQKALLEEIRAELYDIGFDFEQEGNKIILKAIPTDISNGSEESALMEIITEYEENQKIKHTEKRENIAASFSCKSAIKTGKKLSIAEMKALANDILKCDMPYVCPHGRPVILDFTLKELDKRFGRTS